MAYQYITNKNSPNYTPGAQARAVFGYDRVIEGITLHWWGNPNDNPQFDSIVNYLCRANGNTSAHIVATGTGRKAACIVNYSDVAWHSGSAWGNARTIGVELDPRGREEDIDVVAEVIADIRSAFGDVPLYWHSYFTATSCPGVYIPLLEKIDQLSYTKQSNANWGDVTDKNPKTPQPEPQAPQTPTTTPQDVLFKLVVNGKQVAAYSVEANAYKGYVDYGKTGTITQGGKDITAELVAKYTTPSPTANTPEEGGGQPITEKPDYTEENNNLLKQILALLQGLITKLTSIFK